MNVQAYAMNLVTWENIMLDILTKVRGILDIFVADIVKSISKMEQLIAFVVKDV